jgi:chromosome segregation ATPase
VDQKAKTLIIEHPLRQGYRLLNQKPAETTPNAYRFEVKLSPDSTQALAVREERVYLTQTAVSNLTPDVLMTYVENKGLADLARRELGQISDQKTKIAEIDGEILQAEGSLNDANKDEERIRQNIDSLRRVSGQDDLVKKYALQLADQENKIAALRDKISQLKRTLAGLQSQLNTLIAKLEF